MILRARLNFAITSVKKFENSFSQMRRKDVISPSKFCHARPSVNRFRRERHPRKSYFLMSGNSLSRPVKNRIRLLFPSQISFSLNWNRISFLVTEARAWNNSVWTVQIEAPMIGPLYRYLVHAPDPFHFSCKWFIPTSNRRVYNFFSYLIFFFFIAYASLRFTTLDCWLSVDNFHENKPPRHMTPKLHRDWAWIVCFGRGSKHFQKWKSSGLITHCTPDLYVYWASIV